MGGPSGSAPLAAQAGHLLLGEVLGGAVLGDALELARAAGAEGRVVVEVTIDETGRVIAARVVQSNSAVSSAAAVPVMLLRQVRKGASSRSFSSTAM